MSTDAPDRLSSQDLRRWIRDVDGFPKPGIVFKDISPLLLDPRAFRSAVGHMADGLRPLAPDLLLGIEARGFLFAAALAYELGIGLAPVRKPGKLPWRTVSETYELEYGSDQLHLHEDAIAAGARVVVVDDLLATGGTARAVTRLIERLSGQPVAVSVLVELGFLDGRKRVDPVEVQSVMIF